MTTATLSIDLDAIMANWRALSLMSGGATETAAVVKADAYGLGAGPVARALAKAGARVFFVAAASEGKAVRAAVGPERDIYVFSGHMAADTLDIAEHNLIPLLNSTIQIDRHFDTMPGNPFGVQLDSGMNRLGLEGGEFSALKARIMAAGPRLIMSHLACADTPDHPQNAAQLAQFAAMTEGFDVPRSLAATGGILLGRDYHFDLVRPGIGLYGGLPFKAAKPVVRLSIPTIQVRDVAIGETVGYSATWVAKRPTRIATLAAGYADGLIRAMGARARVWAGDRPCPLAGRVSMDLLGVDVTDLPEVPTAFDILGPCQGVDDLATAAGTIGYEILTSLGARYRRITSGG